MPITDTAKKERLRINVRGIVQGVGFRPFVYSHAVRLGLGGFVLNNSAGVTIEVEGEREHLEEFKLALQEKAPPLARIESVTFQSVSTLGETAFVIAHSLPGIERATLVSPDSATCEDCLQEIFDPPNRRYRYPFANCTNCGPRFTIVQDVPYDRANTTMGPFIMCRACQAEYDNPIDRRFHAQPNACPACGPQVGLLDKEGQTSGASDPIAAAARQLANGAVLAIKGLGGYHIACDAQNNEAVTRLRSKKHREARPFALMLASVEDARQLCEVDEEEAALLQSHRRPIVLLKQKAQYRVAEAVAPNNNTLGIMLPYTPLHHLLLSAFAEAVGQGRPSALVMTSGNISEEPIAYRDSDARTRLAPLVDGMLIHNRAIHIRCDDSVARSVTGGQQIIRRSRGYAPEPITLPLASPKPLLACGGHLKNTSCLVKGQQAFVTHHIGDLENLETLTSFREGIEHFKRLFDIYPEAVAYDLHPEYLATKYALDLDLPDKIGVQHHHAHIASVIAEHHLEGPVIGIAADGTGYGTDGAIWGCEVIAADLLGFERLAHLDYVPLPGGDRAVRQPWRMGAVYLAQAYGDTFLEMDIPFVRQLDKARWRALAQMISRGINSPMTSSLGRLFDAVAALLGIRDTALYEGQAAIEMEMLSEASDYVYPFALNDDKLDVRPMLRAVCDDLQGGVPVAQIAGRFHRSVAEMLAAACLLAGETTGLNQVALSGGVFQNRLLLEQLTQRLQGQRFAVYTNRQVPPNDGGLSFGQAAVAAAQLKRRTA